MSVCVSGKGSAASVMPGAQEDYMPRKRGDLPKQPRKPARFKLHLRKIMLA